MLLIICGAGASHDCLPQHVMERIPLDEQNEWCPPLADDLLGNRRSFEEVLFDLPQCAGLVADLQRRIAAGAGIESQLERLQEDATRYPLRHRELMALRFYLQEALWRCGSRWTRLSSGRTYFADLFRRVDVWRHAANERVCVVTFNYDLLVDQALAAQLGMALSTMSGYVSDVRYHYAKLHGSVNWSRRVAAPGGTTYSKRDHARDVIINAAESLAVAEGDYFVRQHDSSLSEDGSLYVPAIAIPAEATKRFECPESQLSALRSDLSSVDRIVVIGWRGAERHFLEELRLLPGLATPTLVVGNSERGCDETATNLGTIGSDPTSVGWSVTGFGAFMETTALEAFLDSSVAKLRQDLTADRFAFGERSLL